MSSAQCTPRYATLLLVTLASVVAGAYVLPGGSILRRMVAARHELELSTLEVQGSLHFYGQAAREAATALGQASERVELETNGTLWMKQPGRCRLEAALPEARPVAAVVTAGRRRMVGNEVPALGVAVEQVCALLGLRAASSTEGRSELEQHLKALGLDTRTTSLARFNGDVAYVLGEPEEGKAQLWAYKESFRPARVRYTDTRGNAWDVRLLDYASPATVEGMPRGVEVWLNGQRALRFTALQSMPRAAVADALFAP